MKKYLFLLFFFPSCLYPQVDSLRDFFDYYPLQLGNYWEYKTKTQQIPYPTDSSAYSVEVKGDTLLDNNKTYKILLRKNIYPYHDMGYYYERIDSSSGCVYRYKNDTTLINNEYKIDSLFAQPGDTINSSRNEFTSFGYYRTLCNSIDVDTILGIPTQIRTYFDESTIPIEEFKFAKGFGYYSRSSCEFSCMYTFLVYAKISGIEYGSKIITNIIENETIPVNYQLYQNYPNPFNPNTNISFVIPKAGNVTLRIYDILGKLIENNNLIFSNGGIHKIKFNGNNYSSGIYLYQIEYAGQTQTRKMLLLK